MKIEAVAKLNNEILKNWGAELTRGHYTPLVLIGTGNDHSKDKIKTIALDNVSNEQLFIILSTLRDELAIRMNAQPKRFLDIVS